MLSVAVFMSEGYFQLRAIKRSEQRWNHFPTLAQKLLARPFPDKTLGEELSVNPSCARDFYF